MGYCQISHKRLIDMHFLARPGSPATRPASWIFEREGSKAIALEIITLDYLGLEAKKGIPSYGCLTVKFHWGKAAKCTKARLNHRYVREILQTIQQVAVK
jgi:hypothetical protein